MIAILGIGAFQLIPPKPYISYIFGALIILVGVPLARRAAKSDPMLSIIWRRYIIKPSYYAPVRSPYGRRKSLARATRRV